jgi:uncharacterized protein involved in exopolysaccharide biosynthesis
MTSSPPAPAALTSDLDVRFYLGLLWRGRMLIASAAGVGLLIGVLAGFVQTPEYRASAMLQIEPPTPTFLTVTDALVGGGNYWQHAGFYNTQFKVLTSKSVGEKAVARLKLTDQPPFQGHPDPASLFMTHVSVEPVPDSRLVNVVVTHRDPKGRPRGPTRWARSTSSRAWTRGWSRRARRTSGCRSA